MNGDKEWSAVPDAALVGYTADPASRQAAFDEIYRRHSEAVLALCAGKLRDPDRARDAAQDTFLAAWADLTGGALPREPHKLRAWLYGIAKHRCSEAWRDSGGTGEMPGGDIEDDEYERASRARLAEVDRILALVAASFTERGQRLYDLSIRQRLRGQRLALALGVSEKKANDATYETKLLVWQGFGAYILALDGSVYCPGLAAILDQYAWDGQTLTRTLRLRILRHLRTCPTCDNCATCNAQRESLIAPFAPALIPILILPELDHAILGDSVTGGGSGGDPPPYVMRRRRSNQDPPIEQAQHRTSAYGRGPGPPPDPGPAAAPSRTGGRAGRSPAPRLTGLEEMAGSAASAGPEAEGTAQADPLSEAEQTDVVLPPDGLRAKGEASSSSSAEIVPVDARGIVLPPTQKAASPGNSSTSAELASHAAPDISTITSGHGASFTGGGGGSGWEEAIADGCAHGCGAGCIGAISGALAAVGFSFSWIIHELAHFFSWVVGLF